MTQRTNVLTDHRSPPQGFIANPRKRYWMLIRDAPIAVPDSDYFLFFPHALLAMLDYETAF